MKSQPILCLVVVGGILSVAANARAEKKPVVARKPNSLRTYRFTAKIIQNDGVTPFKVGEKMTGQFTLDRLARDLKPELSYRATYQSKKNSIRFNHRGLNFVGKGPVTVYTYHSQTIYESFAISALDAVVPKGWSIAPDPKKRGYGTGWYGLTLQNSPPRGAMKSDAIPGDNILSKLTTYRIVRIDFLYGVRFPGGQVNKRASIDAELEQLKRVSSK